MYILSTVTVDTSDLSQVFVDDGVEINVSDASFFFI